MAEIFHELYLAEYPIERIRLIDEYDGDDTVSMEDNNTSCFNYRVVDGTSSLSKHAYGMAIDINPLYNPYVTYPKVKEGFLLPPAPFMRTEARNSLIKLIKMTYVTSFLRNMASPGAAAGKP